jgi:lipoprotein-anchoring transpeptidase ErfK/SrfK
MKTEMRGCRWRPRALLVAFAFLSAALPAPATATVAPTQQTAALLRAHDVHARPSNGSALLASLPARRPITDDRTVLPVLEQRIGTGGVEWLRVRLPGRPNGRTGWIDGRGTISSETVWHLVVDLRSRRVLVYKNGRPVRTFGAVVGKASTPTPRGEFFVEEAVELRPGDAGAPYALALSARSNVLQEFAGGPGQIALHGLRNVGGTPGTAVSHGCVRLDSAAITWLVYRVGPGVPVTIV